MFMASYDVASSSCHGLADIARRIIQHILDPRLLSQTASYDVASSICQALSYSPEIPLKGHMKGHPSYPLRQIPGAYTRPLLSST